MVFARLGTVVCYDMCPKVGAAKSILAHHNVWSSFGGDQIENENYGSEYDLHHVIVLCERRKTY